MWLSALLLFQISARAVLSSPPVSDSPAQAVAQVHEAPSHDPPIKPPLRITSPPLPPEALTVGFFTSVQVNVDENGDNIVGDAANEPSIAIDPTDTSNIVIGWRQFDSVYSNYRRSGYGYSHDAGRSWMFPGSLLPDHQGSDPVLGANSNGAFYYMAISLGDYAGVQLFRSFDKGETWDGPLAVDSEFKDKEWFTIDRTGGIGDGNLYMTWTSNRQFTRSTDGGVSWMDPISIDSLDSKVWGTLSVDPDGVLLCVDHLFHVVSSSNAQDPQQTPVFVLLETVDLGGLQRYRGDPNPDGLLGQPWIATDHSDGPARGNVYLLCSVDPLGNDPLDVRFSRSTDGGATWSGSVRINDDPTDNRAWQWFGTMAVAPSGRIDAAWYDTRNDSYSRRSEVFYAFSTDSGGTWSPNIQVAPVFNSRIGYPGGNYKIGDYIHAISDAAGMNLAYAATYNGEQDIYFVHIAPDCNRNGIHDGDDIASGQSLDLDGDLVPDECQTCFRIRKLVVTCREGVLRAKVRSTSPPGTSLTIDNEGDQRTMTIGADGRGRVKWTRQFGSHRVSVVECPKFCEKTAC